LRNHQAVSLLLLALLLPLPAWAALTPVGTLAITEESPSCSFITNLEVIATPKGAFEVVWGDDRDDFAVKGRRFGRALEPTGPPQGLFPAQGGLVFSKFAGTWAGRYEVALNALEFGNRPDDPAAGYRVSLNLAGDPLAPPARVKPPRFSALVPAAGGASLQFRSEPPIFGSPSCRGLGLLARRIERGGAPISAESRVTRRATAWNGSYFEVDRLSNDTFVAAYSTCNGLVARSLNASGAPVGKVFELPFPDRVGNVGGGNLVLAARGGNDFVVVAMITDSSNPGINGAYTRGVVNGQVFGPTRVPLPPGYAGTAGVIDLKVSPSGSYLLLFRGGNGDPQRLTLFAQELDGRGVPQGAPVAVTGDGELAAAGAADSLPDGRWIVVTRAQSSEDPTACTERLVGTVLASD
jgi:hypothetical protein